MALSLVVVLLLSGIALAGHHEKTVTVKGNVTCAMCTLKTGKECQDVLVVKKGEEKVLYYVVKNDVSNKFGHGCGTEKPAVVTGTVEEKDGKMWLTATKMDEPAEKG
jgi:hypothetical protein